MSHRPDKVHDASTTAVSDAGTKAFRREAGALLTSKESSRTIQHRQAAESGSERLPFLGIKNMNEAASMARNEGSLQAMNTDRDQVAQMLNLNPCPELFDQMVKQDKGAAFEFALRNSEFQTHGLHDVQDASFRKELRLKLTGREAQPV